MRCVRWRRPAGTAATSPSIFAGRETTGRGWSGSPPSSGWDPPWNIATHVDDVLETVSAAGVDGADWIGHSFGGRLVLELCVRAPERVARAALLDPAIDLLPHVGLDFAEDAGLDESFETVDEAIERRLATGAPTPREALQEEMREHLELSADARLRYRYCRPAVVTAYGELCTEPPPPTVLPTPALLVHASQFGLVREEQLEQYERELGDGLEVVAVPGGHIVYWDAFDATAEALERFLL